MPIMIGLIALWLTSTPYFSKLLLGYVEQDQLRKTPANMQRADAIVVLSGMLGAVNSRGGPMYEWSDPDRYFAGLELMQAKKARLIIFTGGLQPWQTQLQSEGDYLARLAKQTGLSANQVVVTEDVQNTAQEAVAVSKYLDQHQLNSIILVTSAFHMPRAERLFENANIQLQTYPVDSKVILADMTPMDFLPDANAFYATQLALRELLGRLYYIFQESIKALDSKTNTQGR